MLTAHQITKTYNAKNVLQDISFNINPGECVGLIGPNGCGKTTLLKILIGQEKPDSGHITRSPSSLRMAYLPQGFNPPAGQTIGQAVNQACGDPHRLEQELARLAAALAVEPQRPDLQLEYDNALRRMQAIRPADLARAEAILEKLGLADIPKSQPLEILSGGQKTRFSLALILMQDPQLLLLDEPTNHLDLEMIEWLEGWLLDEYMSVGSTAALLVSHDRTLIDQTATRILDIDPETHTIKAYQGNYTDYISQYMADRDRQWAVYKDQVDEIRRMKQDIARTKQQSLQVELTTTSRQPGVRRIAKKVAAKAKSREKKLHRYLESDERLDKPKAGWQMKLEFNQREHLGKDVLMTENLSVGYPGLSPLLIDLNVNIQSGMRIALTGPNGSGKTTFMRTIAGEIDPLAGSFRLGASARLGYMSQEQELLNPEWNAMQTIQAENPMNETEARSFLHYFLFSGDDPLRPTVELSYGERARLALARLVAIGCNFLLLDEPINHLDIPSRERFEQALTGFPGTVLAIVHDRYFIQRFATNVWFIEDHQIRHE